MAVGKHEAIAIPPPRVAGVVLEHIAPQHFGNIGHAHGRDISPEQNAALGRIIERARLDAKLPEIVESMVAKEITRITGRIE